MEDTQSIAIHLIVLNGEKYIRQCLATILAQTNQDFELIIFDNGSTDRTKEIIKNYTPMALRYKLIEHEKNLATWGGFEESLRHTDAAYSVLLSVDVLLDKAFLKNVVAIMKQNEKVGAVQAKVLQWRFNSNGQPEKTKLIDTTGFQIYRNRRLINIGHGEEDRGQYGEQHEVFGVEGAVPIFRRATLEDAQISRGSTSWEILVRGLTSHKAEIVDHDMFWYGDDLDLAWRIRLFGWKQIYAPSVIAYHDRSTTKSIAHKWYEHFGRISQRRQIPIKKRRLDWRNYRLAIVKNDYMINILRDLPWIIGRELMVLGYALLFEPQIFLEIPAFFRLLPKMLRKRREIMGRVKVKAEEIHRWFL